MKIQLSKEGTIKDTISRQQAIDAVNHICPVDTEYDCTLLDRVDVRYVLSDLPSVQPEHKKGLWLPDNRPGGGFWVCSECKFPSEAFAANVLYNFCPNCGADMKGEQDEH